MNSLQLALPGVSANASSRAAGTVIAVDGRLRVK